MKSQQSRPQKNRLNFKINNKDSRSISTYRQFFIVDFENGLQNKQFIDSKKIKQI